MRPLVIPTGTTVVAFRDRSTTLEFVINSASPDVTPDNIEWTFEPNQEQTLDVNSAVDSRYQFSQDRRSLNISSLRRNDSGLYTLIATNEAGVDSATIELIVEGKSSQYQTYLYVLTFFVTYLQHCLTYWSLEMTV